MTRAGRENKDDDSPFVRVYRAGLTPAGARRRRGPVEPTRNAPSAIAQRVYLLNCTSNRTS